MVRNGQSSAELIAAMPSLATHRPPWLPWWDPGTVRLVFDGTPPPTAPVAPKLRRDRCERAALMRKRSRMLGTGQLRHDWGRATAGPAVHPGWKHCGAFTRVGEKRKY